MSPTARYRVAELAGKTTTFTPDVRNVLVAMVGDRSSQVRDAAVKAMQKLQLEAADAPVLEGFLTRRSGDLRRGVISLLARQDESALLSSVDRLWEAGNDAQRDAACELLGVADTSSPAISAAVERLTAGEATARQRELLDGVRGSSAGADTVGEGLGLVDPAGLTTVPAPVAAPRGRRFGSDESLRLVSVLDDLVSRHRDTVVTVSNWQGSEEILLAGLRFPPPGLVHWRGSSGPVGMGPEGSGLLLPDVFLDWWDQQSAEPIEALRGYVATENGIPSARVNLGGETNSWTDPLELDRTYGKASTLANPRMVSHVLQWIVVECASAAVIDECLDAVDALFAAIPEQVLASTPAGRDEPIAWNRLEWRHQVLASNPWQVALSGLFLRRPELFSDA